MTSLTVLRVGLWSRKVTVMPIVGILSHGTSIRVPVVSLNINDFSAWPKSVARGLPAGQWRPEPCPPCRRAGVPVPIQPELGGPVPGAHWHAGCCQSPS